MNQGRIAAGIRIAVSAVLLAGLSQASDWYVDAVNGSDANNGQSPQTAWRTISHAVTQLPAGSERILIAAGTYSAQSGELFPIAPKPGHQLIGVAGSQRPVITANGASGSVLLRFASSAAQPLVFGADTRVEHLELRRATRCVELIVEAGEVSPTFDDVRIERMVERGVEIVGLGGQCQPKFERMFIGVTEPTSNSVGIRATGFPLTPAIQLTVLDSFIGDSGGGGVALSGSVDALLERCNFDSLGTGAIGVNATENAPTRLRCVDTAIAYSSFALLSTTVSSTFEASFTRCTIAEVVSPLMFTNGVGTVQVALDSTIVAIPGDSIYTFGQVDFTVSNSLIADGSFDGVNGCFSGDPGFRNAGDGDFRLRWGSACIDAANAAQSGARDLLGARRDVDGNLDSQGRTDIGAYEFTPLEIQSTGELGSALRLDNWGPDSPSVLYWARAGLSAPSSTPFGSFELNPQLARTFRFTTSGAASPSVTQRMIPNQLALVGQTFSFQALTNSSAAPLSRAFSNGVEVLIVP